MNLQEIEFDTRMNIIHKVNKLMKLGLKRKQYIVYAFNTDMFEPLLKMFKQYRLFA